MESDDQSFLRDAHNIMQLFGDKWTFPVMVTLAEGPLRRSEILKEVDSFCADADWLGGTSILHDSILTRTLRKLVGDGLLARHEAENAFPPNVQYSLQPGPQPSSKSSAPCSPARLSSKRFGGSARRRGITSTPVANAHHEWP
jgi:DNA-binding HxlR family transcriptional regulator